MSRTVSGNLAIPVEEALEKLHHLSEVYNIEFKGDKKSGYAKGKGFHLVYEMDGNHCTLTVEKKPLYIPWRAVEKQLAALF